MQRTDAIVRFWPVAASRDRLQLPEAFVVVLSFARWHQLNPATTRALQMDLGFVPLRCNRLSR